MPSPTSSFSLVRGMQQLGAQTSETPTWLWHLLEQTFGPVWDPCPHKPKFDGLTVDWKKKALAQGKRQAYLNPEFKHVQVWLEKALDQLERNHFPSIFLIPFRPQTKYFAELVLPYASEIRIMSERIAFKGFRKPLSQRMCIIVFGKPVRWRHDNVDRTRPLYVDRSIVGQTLEKTIREYVAERGSKLIRDLAHVPHTSQQMHGLVRRNIKKWLALLASRPNTDLYSLLDDTSTTFIRVLLEPAVQAIIFWPRLAMGSHHEPSQYCSYAIWGKPKPTAAQRANLDALPPTYVWQIAEHV